VRPGTAFWTGVADFVSRKRRDADTNTYSHCNSYTETKGDSIRKAATNPATETIENGGLGFIEIARVFVRFDGAVRRKACRDHALTQVSTFCFSISCAFAWSRWSRNILRLRAYDGCNA
jgi:hypothetical protein